MKGLLFLMLALLVAPCATAQTSSRLPPRDRVIPCDSEQLCFDIRQQKQPITASPWVRALVGKQCGPRYEATFRRPWRWYFRRTTLRIEGVLAAAEVAVNGSRLGTTDANGLPAEFDITPALKLFGQNSIVISAVDTACQTVFRAAYLISESKDAPFDFIVETRLSDDMKSGSFVVRDEQGRVLKERQVDDVHLWSPETPFVYMTPIERKWGWWKFGGTNYWAVTLGFRHVQAKDSLALNGRKFPVKGLVNRAIEKSNTPGDSVGGGAYGTKADGTNDPLVEFVRHENMNALRVRENAVDADLYDACDREGVMLMVEQDAATLRNGERSGLYPLLRNHPCVMFVPAVGGFRWRVDSLADAAKAEQARFDCRNIRCESLDFTRGVVRVRNDFVFSTLVGYRCHWEAFAADGSSAARGVFDLGEVPPGGAGEYLLKDFAGVKVKFAFYGNAACVAEETVFQK